MIENRHMRYFLEVARTLHITRASERLNIAQPALTQNIQQLEQELGVKLFERQGRRLSLTEAGRVFEREAEHSLRVFQGAQLAARRAERGEVGKVVIGFQSTAGLSIIPHLLKQLGQKYPEIEVLLREMGSTAQRNGLRRGDLDAAILYAVPDREFAHHELTPESLVIALPDNHFLAARESIALKELANEKFVLPSLEAAELLHRAVLTGCADVGFQPYKVQEVSTAQTALGVVSAGFGVSVLPASVRFIARQGIVLRPIRNSHLQAQLAMMWPHENASPIITKILECLA